MIVWRTIIKIDKMMQSEYENTIDEHFALVRIWSANSSDVISQYLEVRIPPFSWNRVLCRQDVHRDLYSMKRVEYAYSSKGKLQYVQTVNASVTPLFLVAPSWLDDIVKHLYIRRPVAMIWRQQCWSGGRSHFRVYRSVDCLSVALYLSISLCTSLCHALYVCFYMGICLSFCVFLCCI